MDIQKNNFCRIIAAMLLLVSPVLVSAQVPIEKEERIYRVDNSQSQERLVEVDSPVPGAMFEYELTYRNVSGKNLDGIVIRQPVFANASYIYGSASTPDGTELHVSVDNGMTFQPESSLEIEHSPNSSGAVTSGRAFQALQWVFKRSMQVDETTTLRYRVIVD